MNSCQLCGSCSWGPATAPLMQGSFVATEHADLFVCCDNCHSIARKVIVERDPLEDARAIDSHVTPFSAIFPPNGPISTVLEGLKATLPKPETRLERLVRAMLQSPQRNEFAQQNALGVVSFARQIETELDGSTAVETNFLLLRFRDRETFSQWILRGLDYAKERMKMESGVAADFNINRCAKYLADWVQE